MSAVTQGPAAAASVLTGLARALVQQGKLRPDRAETLARKAVQSNTQFIDELVAISDATGMTASGIAKFAADTFGHPMFDLAAFDAEQLPSDIIDRKLVASLRVLALRKRGNRLAVGVSDPTNFQALDQVKFQTQLALDVVVVEHDKLLKLVENAGRSVSESLERLVDDDVNFEDLLGEDSAQQQQDEAASIEVDDAPVVRFLQKLLLDAISDGASDIHFEPYEKLLPSVRVPRWTASCVKSPSRRWRSRRRLVTRIKVVSKLDISEKRVPQDGRMKLVLSGQRAIDFRVSTLPTLYGEKVVMRILDPSQAKMGIESLGYEPEQRESLVNAISRPYGMVLVTGPTGSGKTVSLYTCLNLLNKPGVNISTAEDPAEIQLPGVNQVNVNEKAGLTFATALRAFLRQDPDIIMVGEIRDLETAEIAIKAAQTGHMVMSTLHTNDAPVDPDATRPHGCSGLQHRLVDHPHHRAASGAAAVRLQGAVRPARRGAGRRPASAKNDLDGSVEARTRAVGCERCKGSGYKGRVGIYQVMPITEAIQRTSFIAAATRMEIADQAQREGVDEPTAVRAW
ncbi:MAG: ATPase, T2SS/T4P/T4SS family [Burkholderiaceae bacterium]|nr:ATPase, T2SS/T4P/T4SS family [Burkholderiaceae bacterium]